MVISGNLQRFQKKGDGEDEIKIEKERKGGKRQRERE